MSERRTLKELQDAALEVFPVGGLFNSNEISDILESVNIDSTRAVKKILRETGHFAPIYDDVDTMSDAIEDFFIDNASNIHMADAVLNGRTYNPLENTDRYEEAYEDNTETTDNIAQRHSSSNTGKAKVTTTPGKLTTTNEENSKTEVTNKPRVLGSQTTGSSTVSTGTANEGTDYSSKTTQEQEISINETEQLTDATTTTDAYIDKRTTKVNGGARHVHGNIGVTTNQQMASAELQYIMQFKSTLDFIIKLFISELLVAVYD